MFFCVCCALLCHRIVQCYYAALLRRRGPHIALHSVCPSVCLSVCLSVRLSVPLLFILFYSRTVLRANIQNRKTSVFAYGLASRMYFSARTEGRISYGHLGETRPHKFLFNSFHKLMLSAVLLLESMKAFGLKKLRFFHD